MQYKNSLVVGVVYIVIFSLQQINQQRDTLMNHRHFLPLRNIKLQKRSEIYSKTAIWAVKKGEAQSGSPIQDGQGKKVVKSRWRPRNGCDGWSMAKKY